MGAQPIACSYTLLHLGTSRPATVGGSDVRSEEHTTGNEAHLAAPSTSRPSLSRTQSAEPQSAQPTARIVDVSAIYDAASPSVRLVRVRATPEPAYTAPVSPMAMNDVAGLAVRGSREVRLSSAASRAGRASFWFLAIALLHNFFFLPFISSWVLF